MSGSIASMTGVTTVCGDSLQGNTTHFKMDTVALYYIFALGSFSQAVTPEKIFDFYFYHIFCNCKSFFCPVENFHLEKIQVSILNNFKYLFDVLTFCKLRYY